jgi:hypothetical protein
MQMRGFVYFVTGLRTYIIQRPNRERVRFGQLPRYRVRIKLNHLSVSSLHYATALL